MSIDKLQKGQVKLLELLNKQSKQIEELKQLMVKQWRAEDMEENNGKFRYPFDENGNLLPNTNITGRLN
tara:strand:+ start:194 stop:400 length:207 start_codon:yes stop_codon:yes gene_type:complete